MKLFLITCLCFLMPQIVSAEMIRKSNIVRGSDHSENVIYEGGKEVARYKEGSDGIFDVEGKMPDGEVKIIDEYKRTTGVEYYKYGLKHGSAEEYYDNGKRKSEAKYNYGKLVKKAEYSKHGKLRYEVDYSDAIEKDNDVEVGVGKSYYPSGKLKYEWNLRKGKARGYKRSYNRDGTLRHEELFDRDGKRIESAFTQIDLGASAFEKVEFNLQGENSEE